MKNSVPKNTVYNIIKSCSAVVFPLITFPYISRVLLTDNVGKVNFGSSIVSYFSLIASLGITTYAVRECSKVKNDKEKLGAVASEILSINICTTVIAYLALAVLLLVARPLHAYRELIVIQSLSIAFTTIGADWLNTTLEDFRYITIRTFLFQLVSLLLMFIFVKEPDDYIKYACITVISSSGGNIANVFYRKRYCRTRFTKEMQLKKHLPPIILLFAMILAQQVFVNSDTTILGILRGDHEVGLYSTSVKIYNIVSTLMTSVAWVVMSELSYSFSKKDYKRVNALLKYVIGFTATFGIPCVVGMGILAPQIIEIIAGPSYIEASISLRILAVSMAFSLIWGIVMNMILLPAGVDKPCLFSCIISAVVNIIANLIFIPSYGFVAAAATTAASQVIGLIICIPFIDKNVVFQNKCATLLGPIIGTICMTIYLIYCINVFSGLWFIAITGIVGSIIIYFIFQILLKNAWLIEFMGKFFEKIKKD